MLYAFKNFGIRIIMPGNFQYSGDLEVRMGADSKTGGAFTELTIVDSMIVSEKINFFNP